MKKIIFALGLGIGFVVGSRAGRGPYEQLERTARNVAEDPTVREKVDQAREVAGKAAHDATEIAKEKGPELAQKAKDSASSGAEQLKEKNEERKAAKSDSATDAAHSDAAGGDAEVGDKKLES
ncbi:MAG: hypothetical protein Q4G40_02445 [Brachybacterium sp.]|nr:hypothetical protein [Brachybacterium sp.]